MNQVVNQTFNRPASNLFAEERAKSKGELSGGITGGFAIMRIRGKVWTIHHQQQEMPLMRDDGDGPRNSIDVVILGANPILSKTWYENGFEDGNTNPPDCMSTNGIVPDQGVPKKQAVACAGCPRNAWNTDPQGGKGKACKDHRRLAIVPLPDIKNEALGGPILLRCPATSIADLSAFDAKYDRMGYPFYSLGVKISFDTKESFPKFVLEAIRPLDDSEAAQVMEWRKSPELARVTGESVAPVPVDVVVTGASPSFSQPAPAAAPAPAPAAAAPAPAPAAAAAPAAATGFGPVNAPAAAAPKPKPAARQMTGFGATAAQPVTQPVTQQGNGSAAAVSPPQAATPSSPPDVTKFDASLDDRLNKLIND